MCELHSMDLNYTLCLRLFSLFLQKAEMHMKVYFNTLIKGLSL